MLLLAGFRRLEALTALNIKAAPGLVFSADYPLNRALELALADNLDRGWNAAEQALSWHFLSANLPNDEALRLAAYLGLDRSPKLRDWCLRAAGLPVAALEALADDRLDLECAARLADWEPASREALLHVFAELAPSKQKKKQWLDWLEDISRRENLTPAKILQTADFAAALAEVPKKGRPAVENTARQALWCRRYPLLAELTQRREEIVRTLNLPPEARLELDSTLEDLSFRLNLTFTDWASFGRLADLMGDLRQNQHFQALIEDADEK